MLFFKITGIPIVTLIISDSVSVDRDGFSFKFRFSFNYFNSIYNLLFLKYWGVSPHSYKV